MGQRLPLGAPMPAFRSALRSGQCEVKTGKPLATTARKDSLVLVSALKFGAEPGLRLVNLRPSRLARPYECALYRFGSD